jgi:hypothetical protein
MPSQAVSVHALNSVSFAFSHLETRGAQLAGALWGDAFEGRFKARPAAQVRLESLTYGKSNCQRTA